MTDEVRQFSAEGMRAFSAWLDAGAEGSVPKDLLRDSSFTVLLSNNGSPAPTLFADRFEFGEHLVKLLGQFDSHAISFNRELWTWLAARFFDELCPVDARGVRKLRKHYVYVLGDSRIYYRHLVRTPWFLVQMHGEACKFLLANTRSDDAAPLGRQSYLLDQLAARQFVIASPTLIAAAKALYTSPVTGLPRIGAGAKGAGSPRRLALVANQLSLTYDIRNIPVENFLRLLPAEFAYRR